MPEPTASPLSVDPENGGVGQPLRRRVALVTGGGRGIGRAAALELARLGAAVAVLARSPDQVRQVAQEILAHGRPALALTADVADHSAVQAAVQHLDATLGPADILVNCAGVMPLGPLAAGDPAEWRYAVEVNLLGAYDCLRAVLPGMLARRWGRIVNLSSAVAAMPAIRNRSAYVVSKAALDRLTVAAAAETAGTGVTVNTIYPGMTDTPMLAQIRDAPAEVIGPEQQALIRQRYARGDLHQPAEAGRLVAAIVLSDLHGQVVDLDSEQSRELVGRLPSS